MTKTTTLWIDPNLVIRHSEKGWPEFDYEMPSHVLEDLEKEMAQAKAESIPFEDHNAVLKLVYANKDKNGISILTSMYADTFVEIEGEVEVVDQYHDGHAWYSVADLNASGGVVLAGKRRTIARLKPASSAMSFTEGMGVEIIGTKNYDFLATDSINPINQNVAIGWKAGDPPDSIFTREDVRAMIEQARAEALKDIRSRILEGVDAKLHFINKDAQRQAIEAVSKTLDELNIK